MRIENLREYLTDALSNVLEVSSIEARDAISDAGEQLEAVRHSQPKKSRSELSILLVVVESSQLSHYSVEVREIAITIKVVVKSVRDVFKGLLIEIDQLVSLISY